MIHQIISGLILLAFLSPAYSQIRESSRSEVLSSTGLSITIGGSFITTGTFSASSGERLDKFVTRVFNQAKAERLSAVSNPQRREQTAESLDGYAKRNITLKKADGHITKIDLEKFHLTGEAENNPFLMNDDFIFFPEYDSIKGFVSVAGAVNKETKFQFVEGDKLQDAVAFAQGYSSAYEKIDSVVIYRLKQDGDSESMFSYTINENPALQRGDRILVSAARSEKKDFRVFVSGEVNKPGYIPISRSKTTLREVIERAGGFTVNANLRQAELLRGTNIYDSRFSSESLESYMMNRMSNLTTEDSNTFLLDNKLRLARGNGLINFNEIFIDSLPAGKFLVRDNDYINIPQKLDLIYVFGHVNSPGYVPYEPNKNYDFYLKKAGGKGQNPKEEIYIIKGKTRSWSAVNPDKPEVLEPGDYIWVPKQQSRTFDYYLGRVAAISSVLTALATITLLFIQITKY